MAVSHKSQSLSEQAREAGVGRVTCALLQCAVHMPHRTGTYPHRLNCLCLAIVI